MKRHRERRQKVVFLMIDGLADVSIPRLGHKTPLQAAKNPMMDAIARTSVCTLEQGVQLYVGAGVNGLMDPVEPGLACGSDTAHLSILGYPPRQYVAPECVRCAALTLLDTTAVAGHLSLWVQA